MDGDAQKDLALTAARVSVVREYLAGKFGIGNSQLRTMGLGKQKESRPDADWGLVQILIYPAETGMQVGGPTPTGGSDGSMQGLASGASGGAMAGSAQGSASGASSGSLFNDQTTAADPSENQLNLSAGGSTKSAPSTAFTPYRSYVGAGIHPLILSGDGQSGVNLDDDGIASVSDDVAATPEPGSFYLLGIGLLGLIEVGRRKLRA
jgi:hypothetical protein